ncbi:MAG TPA: transglycosylase domain-containing protein [Patescibacteria group bacterium]|nr:transglycosylase domain-containing protein [Patescibacteria group bacterium]
MRKKEKGEKNIFFDAVTRGLVLVGRPFYVLLSGLVAAIVFIFNATGKAARFLFSTFKKLAHKPKAKPKKEKPKRVRKVRTFDLSRFFKLEWLRIVLVELKLTRGLKSIVLIPAKLPKNVRLKLKLRLKFLVPLACLFFFILLSYLFIFRSLPSPRDLKNRDPEVSTKIYDRNGNLLFKIYKDQNRTIVPLTSIPPHVRLATLAAEDAEFYTHPGFSLKGISRALVTDFKTGALQGGSTITQQLVKNALLSPEKTLTRKIKELILSVEVEAAFTKDQILEMYLNEVSYGGTAYGIQEASQEYFGKDVGDLDLAEAALLAGLPKSPTTFSPFGQNPITSVERQREVLRLMRINKFITPAQEEEALNKRLSFAPNKTGIYAPHFVMYVRQILVDRYGEGVVAKGGLEVTTSLDIKLQQMTDSVVKTEVSRLRSLNVGNGAALIINPQTGEILAMTGSKDYFDTSYDGQVNVTTSLRQPGSSIKVVNYAYALSHGYTPATIIDDSPITYVTPGSPPYSPVNYDGKFRGKISLRSAFAQSRNIPAVKVLASYGVSNMILMGKSMGVTTWNNPSDYGLSLTLGGGAVKMTELVQVYATVANFGQKPELLPILEVKDYKGSILERHDPKLKQVLDPRVAFIITDILKDNTARSPEFGFNSYLVVKDHPEVAVKTGTSNDLRDNWTVGYNQNFLVATWVGNNDNSPMSRIASGVTGASPIWNKIMSAILSDKSSIDWKAPDGVSRVNICTITGTLPCGGCPTRQEWFLNEDTPERACTPESIQKIVSPTPIPVGNPILDNGASTTGR